MKRILILVVIAFLIVGISMIIMNVRKLDIKETIEFNTYNKYKIDAAQFLLISNDFAYPDFEHTYTYFGQIYDFDAWKQTVPEFDKLFPEIRVSKEAYRNKYLALSFGREVLEMHIIGEWCDEKEIAVVYGEKYYPDTMFLYVMDKVPGVMGMASEYYIMKGSERVFLGYSQFQVNGVEPLKTEDGLEITHGSL